eukprot:jgi/Ulvmu1/6451/UM003_0081.1
MAGTDVGEDGSGSFEVATWRVVTLFLVIVAVDTAWEFLDEFVTHRLQTRMHVGLMHAWEQLKFETMALGLISLLLVVGEEQLLRICINSPDKGKDSYGHDTAAEDAQYDHAGAPVEAYDALHDDGHHRRRLMGSGGGDSCPDGEEPLWESELIHKAHILIFLIAVCHIAYAMVSIALSMASMRRWHKFEQRVNGGELLPLPLGGLQKHGESSFVFGLRQCLRQFTHSLDVATYSALRALFVGRVNVGPDFNFAAMIQEYLTEEFARVVRFDIVMWGIAILWMTFPDGSYGGFWMTGFFLLLSVVAGTKLTVVAMHLARHAYGVYYEPSAPVLPPPPRAASRDVARELARSTREISATGGLGGALSELKSVGSGDDSTAADVDGAAVEVAAAPGPVVESLKPAAPSANDNPSAGIAEPRSAEHSPTASRALRRAIRGHSQRIKAADTSSHAQLLDLFWFCRPRLMLHIFRYAFFQNAIALAAVIFGFWQDEHGIFGGAVQGYDDAVRAVAYALLFCVLAVLVHTSTILFPLYALTAGTAEFGSPEGVLDFARRRGIRPDLVKFIQETEPADSKTHPATSAKRTKPKLGSGFAARGRSIPEHCSDEYDDDGDEPVPPVAACCDGATVDSASGAGPHALSAASVFTNSAPVMAMQLAKRGSSDALSPLGGGALSTLGGGATSPARWDSGALVERPQPVALAHAYSGAVDAAARSCAVGAALAALHAETDTSAAGHQPAGHHPAVHAVGHAVGMTNTVQGLLEGMAAKRAQAMASRMRRPRR